MAAGEGVHWLPDYVLPLSLPCLCIVNFLLFKILKDF